MSTFANALNQPVNQFADKHAISSKSNDLFKSVYETSNKKSVQKKDDSTKSDVSDNQISRAFSPDVRQFVQKSESSVDDNQTGLPDEIKMGAEKLSGFRLMM